jgi:hypothetical protein
MELTDVGSRWQHLVDLREIWQNALANLQRIKPQYISVGDKVLMSKLATAVEMTDQQIDLLAKYKLGAMSLRQRIDAIPPISKETDEHKDSNSPNP